MFIATGQDVANVAEGSAGIVYAELTPEKDLYLSITIPSLIVATHGGGTGLPTQRECLEVLGCVGKGKVNKFAEIVAGVVLAGEISLAAAISSLEWVQFARGVWAQSLNRPPGRRRHSAPGASRSCGWRGPSGLLRRLLVTWRHFLGLLFGGLAAYVRAQREEGTGRGLKFLLLRLLAAVTAPFVGRELRHEPLPGAVPPPAGAARTDLHQTGPDPEPARGPAPQPITNELKHLLNRLPVVPLPVLVAIIEQDLQAPGRGAVPRYRPGAARLGLDRADPPGHDSSRATRSSSRW